MKQTNRPTDPNGAPFGTSSTGSLLRARYDERRWSATAIVPHAGLDLSPMNRALHYGQSVFEGVKAYRQPDGTVAVFRLREHLERLNRSARRLCMPEFDVEELLRGIERLIQEDAEYVPEAPSFLYLRPFIYATQADLHPIASATYELLVLLSPGRAIYGDERGLRIRTENEFVRAAPGGTGDVKCAGNYASSLLARERARREGFDEVLWLDAHERKLVEETSTMNVFIVQGSVLTTPELSGTILPGMTRDSLLQLAAEMGVPVSEQAIHVDRLDWSRVEEAFASGTAAGTVHIGELVHAGERLYCRPEPGPVERRLGSALSAIQQGHRGDPFGWLRVCEPVPCLRPSWVWA